MKPIKKVKVKELKAGDMVIIQARLSDTNTYSTCVWEVSEIEKSRASDDYRWIYFDDNNAVFFEQEDVEITIKKDEKESN